MPRPTTTMQPKVKRSRIEPLQEFDIESLKVPCEESLSILTDSIADRYSRHREPDNWPAVSFWNKTIEASAPEQATPDASMVFAATRQFAAELQSRLHAAESSELRKRLDELDARVKDIEHRVSTSVKFGPPKRVISPKLKWLRDNRQEIKEKYAGEWIAISETGVLGHAVSLNALYMKMKQNDAKGATYLRVSEPLTVQN